MVAEFGVPHQVGLGRECRELGGQQCADVDRRLQGIGRELADHRRRDGEPDDREEPHDVDPHQC